MRFQAHRNDTGRQYAGLTIHAPAGVHERAMALVNQFWSRGDTILDLGAGSGAFTQRLIDHGYCAQAVDLNIDDMAPGIQAVQADMCKGAHELFGDSTLDGIVALELMEHLDGPQSLLKESYRILKPGGGILLSTPNVTHLYSRIKFLITGRLWLFDPTLYWITGHTTPLPVWLLAEHLKHAGFEGMQVGYAGEMPIKGIQRPVGELLCMAYRPRNAALGSIDDASTLLVYAVKPELK